MASARTKVDGRLALTSSGRTVAAAQVARTPWARAVGLLSRRHLDSPDGLLIDPCSSVHTWFMRFPIDVVYLDRDWRVVKVVRDLRPWRFSLGGRGARMALELAAGEVARLGLRAGDQIDAEPA